MSEPRLLPCVSCPEDCDHGNKSARQVSLDGGALPLS